MMGIEGSPRFGPHMAASHFDVVPCPPQRAALLLPLLSLAFFTSFRCSNTLTPGPDPIETLVGGPGSRAPNRHGRLVGFRMDDMPLHFSPTGRLQQTAVGVVVLRLGFAVPIGSGQPLPAPRGRSTQEHPPNQQRSHLTQCTAKGVAQSRSRETRTQPYESPPSDIGSPTRPSPSHVLALERRGLTLGRGNGTRRRHD
jgi:hypothetical protein